ncbi:MAG: hypothetical protein COA94_06800 [Rickettsiales bacterium]|nr:MAG: hypothetical protein COA94_06800 [Rickettsiales bacterium]
MKGNTAGNMKENTISMMADTGSDDIIDRVNDILEMFNTHEVMPDDSKCDHVFAKALSMLMVSLKWSGNKRHLFESLSHTKGREIDLLDILNSVANLGYTSHEITISMSEIDDRLMPCLFIPAKRTNSPLVLLSKNEGIITAFDSRDKKIIEFAAGREKGEGYFFERINQEDLDEERKTQELAGMSWFDIIFSRLNPVVKEIILASFFINIFALAMPLFIMSIYDKVIGAGAIDTLVYLAFGVSIAMISEFTLRIIRSKSVVWLGVRLDNIISNAIFERLLFMKAAYTEGASVSSQISRVKSFESIRKFFTTPAFSVIVEIPFTIILLMAIWLIAGPLVYIPIVAVFLFILMLLYYQSKIRVSMQAAAKASGECQRYGMETFMKINYLHHNGIANSWLQQYKEKLSKASMASFRSNITSSIIESVAHSVTIASGLAVVTFGVHLIWAGEMSMGALVATMILIWRILGPLKTLCSMLPRIEQLRDSIRQINRLTNIETERSSTILKRPIEHLNGDIKLTNVGIRYSMDAEPLFVGLDLDIKAGEIIAITGTNGSGKSSLLKLINGLYRPQTGTVRIDGTNILQMEPIELRNYIAYLPQIPNFFHGSIKDNILLVNPLATEEDVVLALEKSGAMEMIKNLTHGIHTIIRANNPTLPNTFGYTLNLARVFLKSGNILLLDELPNSSLNEKVGKAYKQLIIDSRGKKTVFFASQRDDFLKLADKVILFKPGNRPVTLKSNEFINKYGQD